MVAKKFQLPNAAIIFRGGVEDTNLEAKAKDTKKIRGQGQRQECSRPRTKDTNANVFLRKKVLKVFFGRSPKKKKRSRKTFFSQSTKF